MIWCAVLSSGAYVHHPSSHALWNILVFMTSHVWVCICWCQNCFDSRYHVFSFTLLVCIHTLNVSFVHKEIAVLLFLSVYSSSVLFFVIFFSWVRIAVYHLPFCLYIGILRIYASSVKTWKYCTQFWRFNSSVAKWQKVSISFCH